MLFGWTYVDMIYTCSCNCTRKAFHENPWRENQNVMKSPPIYCSLISRSCQLEIFFHIAWLKKSKLHKDNCSRTLAFKAQLDEGYSRKNTCAKRTILNKNTSQKKKWENMLFWVKKKTLRSKKKIWRWNFDGVRCCVRHYDVSRLMCLDIHNEDLWNKFAASTSRIKISIKNLLHNFFSVVQSHGQFTCNANFTCWFLRF